VPGKIQEFLLVTVDACALSGKIQGFACVPICLKFENLNFSA
jgi:hypothetical protein